MCNATHWKRAAQTLSQALAEVEFMRGVGEEVVVVVVGCLEDVKSTPVKAKLHASRTDPLSETSP